MLAPMTKWHYSLRNSLAPSQDSQTGSIWAIHYIHRFQIWILQTNALEANSPTGSSCSNFSSPMAAKQKQSAEAGDFGFWLQGLPVVRHLSCWCAHPPKHSSWKDQESVPCTMSLLLPMVFLARGSISEGTLFLFEVTHTDFTLLPFPEKFDT